jgi:C-22 sterol desaturase
MEAVNSTSGGFSSVLAGTKYANVALPPQVDYVIEAVSNAGVWTWVFTLIALCVAYDQSALLPYWTLAPHC